MQELKVEYLRISVVETSHMSVINKSYCLTEKVRLELLPSVHPDCISITIHSRFASFRFFLPL